MNVWYVNCCNTALQVAAIPYFIYYLDLEFLLEVPELTGK